MDGRRGVLKKLFAFPWMVGAMQVPIAAVDAAASHRQAGFKLLRFINTLELWHKNMTGHYVAPRELRHSAAFAKLKSDPRAVEFTIGIDRLSMLNWEHSEMIPGWVLQFRLTADSSGYQAVLEDTAHSLGHLSTDNSGVISFTGVAQANGHVRQAAANRPSLLLTRVLAYASVATGLESSPPPCIGEGCLGWCCECDDVCCIPCTWDCRSQPVYCGGEYCMNCGCQSCTWACPICE